MRALFVVNEPGEFHELLQLALLLRRSRNAVCGFLFIRPDYASAESHSEACRRHGLAYLHVDQDFSPAAAWHAFNPATTDDYRPTYLSQPHLFAESERRVADLLNDPDAARLLEPMPGARRAALVSWIAAWPYRVVRRIRSLGPMRPLREMAAIRPNLRRIRAIKLLALAAHKSFRPDVVVFGQDFAGSENAIVAYVAEGLGVERVILPFAMGTTKEINESLYRSLDHRLGRDPLSRHVARRYPKWVNAYRGRLLLRAPPSQVLAYELSRIDTPTPWTPLSSRSIVLLPSQQAVDYYAQAGLAPERLRLTGSLNDRFWTSDPTLRIRNLAAEEGLERLIRRNIRQKTIANAVRHMVADALTQDQPAAEGDGRFDRLQFFLGRRFQPKQFSERAWEISQSLQGVIETPGRADREGPRRIIVASWVTNQFGPGLPPIEFKEYHELSRAWATTLHDLAEEHGATVVVSLHPTLPPAELAYLENEFGFVVWRGRLIEILPSADLFVACVSSTLLWASNLCVPAVNYDVYRYGYREFAEAGSIVTVDNHHEFQGEIRQLLSDPERGAALRARAEERRRYWGCFDGQSDARILQAIDDVIAGRQPAAA